MTLFGDIFFQNLNKKKASSDFGDKILNMKEFSLSQLENFGLGDGAVTVRWRCGDGAVAVRWRCGDALVHRGVVVVTPRLSNITTVY